MQDRLIEGYACKVARAPDPTENGRYRSASRRVSGLGVACLVRQPAVPEPQRQRILALAEEHGYVVNQAARNLRLQSTRTIGLVLPMGHEVDQQITDPFQLELIGHLSEAVFRRGYDLLISKIHDARPGWLKTLVQSHRFDAMLVLGQSDQHDALNELATHYDPMVVWGEHLPDQRYCSVGVDNVLGGRLATEHLLTRGRKRILFMGPSKVPEGAARQQGFKDALVAAGCPTGPDQIVETGFVEADARASASALIARDRHFDAVFAASDVIALALITALKDAGRSVPEDVSVCGFDDVALARHLNPPLTTIRQPLSVGGQTMVDLLFQRMGGEHAGSVLIPAELVVRGST